MIKLAYMPIFLICLTESIHAQVPYPELSFKYDWRGKCIDFIGCLLLLELWHYLDSEPWKTKISEQDTFVDLVFHELLHIWVDENVVGTSELLTKYQNEHKHVREHIHLMALQKMVYTNLNRPDIIDMLDISYRTQCLPEYRRAWEIVNDIEGYEAIIQDIIDALM